MPSPLSALSPLDGRYHKQLAPLTAYCSEAALIRYRVRVEIEWLIALAQDPVLAEIRPFSAATVVELRQAAAGFGEADAARVKEIEARTNHDVKAIEYWLKERFSGQSEVAAAAEFIHFACTS
jgi:adenylosuccinate lyase